MNRVLNLDSIVVRRPDLIATAIDRDKVYLDVSSGKYFGMNPVGSAIWGLIEKPIAIHAVCDRLIARFDVSEQLCETETLTFCQALADAGSLVID